MSTSPVSSTGTYQRARRPEQKLERRDAILGAARELALRDGVRAVTLADIAARVGIHKSALLRYFETREQIFLELTAEAWREWVTALHAGLDQAAPDAGAPAPRAPAPEARGPELRASESRASESRASESRASEPRASEPRASEPRASEPRASEPRASEPGASAARGPAVLVADVFARGFGDRPLLCDLIAHTPLNLERNVSPEAVRRYKLTSLAAVDEAAVIAQRALPELTLAECGEFVAALASLAGAVWQIANPGPALAELYAADPALARACVDLTPRLRRTAEILLAGLIASRAR
jgi:AcrR family transcriptional regulator